MNEEKKTEGRYSMGKDCLEFITPEEFVQAMLDDSYELYILTRANGKIQNASVMSLGAVSAILQSDRWMDYALFKVKKEEIGRIVANE